MIFYYKINNIINKKQAERNKNKKRKKKRKNTISKNVPDYNSSTKRTSSIN